MAATLVKDDSDVERLERYNWTALGPIDPETGQREEVVGTLKATNRESVRMEISNRGLIPTNIDLAASGGITGELNVGGRKRPKLIAVAEAVSQMSTMLNAGMGLPEIIEDVKDSTEDKPLRDALSIVASDLRRGVAFFEALAKHPLVFDSTVIYIIEASEEGGFLARGLEDIAANLKIQVEIRGKVKSAMTYPVILGVMTVIVAFALITFLVPMFTALYDDLSDGTAKLPPVTRFVVMVSDNMPVLAPLLIGLSVGFFFWYRANSKREGVRSFFDGIKLKTPVMKSLIIKTALSSFTHNLSSLIMARVGPSRALDIVSRTVNNYHMESVILEAKEAVEEGRSISEVLMERPDLFPPFITKMIRTGESTGDLPKMLDAVAESCDRDVKNLTDTIASLIEPFMIVILGGIVGTLIVALYLPIFSMGDFLQK